MKIQIEKDFPFVGKAKCLDYEIPFDKMECGDSFLIDCDARERSYILAKSRLYFTRSKQPYRFASKKVEGGFRFWKIER